MTGKDSTGLSETRKGYWWRVLRPLFWWLLLVLAMLAVHQHQLAMERTRIYLSVTMYENRAVYDATVMLDGHPVANGEKISLGSHQLTVTQPKAVGFSTNFFGWYGRNDFGKINLKRAMGTLTVTAEPPAQSISIIGPEFSLNLYSTLGTNVTVPTDQYQIEARYPHWSQSQNRTVSANGLATCAFSPRFGALHLTCNRDDARYDLKFANGQSVENGNLPSTVTSLPAGSYELTVSYHNHQLQKSVTVEAGATNDLPL